ncbi:MAG: GtrA family protein [Clostridia bacterium]|nr:GtrA family protein [Clostridia bacterium]
MIEKIKYLITDKYRKPFRFVVVGVLNTLVDFLVFLLCNKVILIHYTVSQVIGYCFGVLNSFTFNKLWTFESRNTKKKTGMEFIRFIMINAVSLGVSVYGISLLVENFNVNVIISKIAVTLIAQLINYIGYKVWVFKK